MEIAEKNYEITITVPRPKSSSNGDITEIPLREQFLE